MSTHSTALFVWRFQPFHKWHLDAISQILSENKYLLIIIWSSNKTWTNKNPLNNETRLDLIKKVLKEENIDLSLINFFFVPDFNDWEKWKNYIFEHLPHFDIVYSASNDTLNYFNKEKETSLLKINVNISATNVRELICKNDNHWKEWTWIGDKDADTIKGHEG